jgi:hypothetical protein
MFAHHLLRTCVTKSITPVYHAIFPVLGTSMTKQKKLATARNQQMSVLNDNRSMNNDRCALNAYDVASRMKARQRTLALLAHTLP